LRNLCEKQWIFFDTAEKDAAGKYNKWTLAGMDDVKAEINTKRRHSSLLKQDLETGRRADTYLGAG
jgi:hypothetical protein